VKNRNYSKNKVRIISGSHRGRSVEIPEVLSLRPTGSRIRETLFNWLQHSIIDSVSLDLFAGSGILSFEALSRGARKSYLIDQSHKVITHLKKTANLLQFTNLEILKAVIPSDLAIDKKSIDIVFLDPPFGQFQITKLCEWLHSTNWLKNGALVYIEIDKNTKLSAVPTNFTNLKQKIAGNVCYSLFQYTDSLDF